MSTTINNNNNANENRAGEILTVEPIFVRPQRVSHQQGFLWGRYGGLLSGYHLSLRVIQIFLNTFLLLLGFIFYNPSNPEESDIFWLLLIGLNTFFSFLLYLDIIFLLKYDKRVTKMIIVTHTLEFGFWLLQIWVKMSRDFDEEKKNLFSNFYLISFTLDLIIQCLYCCNTKQFGSPAGYFFGISVIWTLFRNLGWMKSFGIISGSWPLVLLIFYLFGFLGFFIFAFSVLVTLLSTICCVNKWEVFLKTLPMILVYFYFSTVFLVIHNLEGYLKDGNSKIVILGALGCNVLMNFIICIKIVRARTFSPPSLNGTQNSVQRPSMRHRNAPAVVKQKSEMLNKYLSFMQVGSNLFENVKSDDELKKFKADEKEVCIICFDGKPNTIYLPCLHGGICGECSKDIVKDKAKCPLCRVKLEKIFVYEKKGKGKLFCKEEIFV